MTPEAVLGVIGGALVAVGAGIWKVLLLWAAVRREAIEASKVAAAVAVEAQKEVSKQASLDHHRMIEALVDQAKSMVALGGELRTLTATLNTKLDTIVEWRERTPVEGLHRVDESELNGDRPPSRPGRPARPNPQGYRPPRPGDHHDE